MVFNHTAEGTERGPTLCFRGIDNAIFYMLADDKRFYKEYASTGNNINTSHPVVQDYILTALRYWMGEMHVDGFRFDLASVLSRDEAGKLLPNAPLLESIDEDPFLQDVKLIAEAWDTAGAYEVGSFSEKRWAEWNGRYRDDIQPFLARRGWHAGFLCQPHLWQCRYLYQLWQRPRGQCQLRYLPRRLHPERPGELLRQAK